MNARLFIVMGVAGCGKSTVGDGVAQKFDGTFLEGDAFHPQSNIDKMSKGEALTDEDRWPWLEIIATVMSANAGLVFTGCSALKKSYREFISKKAGENVLFIYLDGSKELIAKRMSQRTGHFMPTSLLDSQFDTLEIPTDDELKILVDISGSTQDIINTICERLQPIVNTSTKIQATKEDVI